MSENRIVKRHEVTSISGLKRSTIYKGMAEGTFPKNIKLTPSGRAVGWKLSEINAWIEARATASGASTAEATPTAEARG